MIKKLLSVARHGLDAHVIDIEIDISAGLPSVIMVGLADKSIQESKERIRTSFKSINVSFPLKKITINFAPAHIYKAGSHFDLAIAIGILYAIDAIQTPLNDTHSPSEIVCIGELSLDGTIRKVHGIMPMLLALKQAGYTSICIPKENEQEAQIIPDMNIIAVSSLAECVAHISGHAPLTPTPYKKPAIQAHLNAEIEDFKNIKGQKLAKRAFEIAAAGFHNISLIGEPGSGKTLLSRAFVGLLPPLSETEMIECAQIYSVAQIPLTSILQGVRPFRNPHHSSSSIALTGGTAQLKPGEVTLAHRGVLFLDEFAEFSSKAIEVLRQPIEDGVVTISRSSGTVQYPSQFILICASNPTHQGGFSTDMPSTRNRYIQKISGPIADRIDIHVKVYKPEHTELLHEHESESTRDIQKRVLLAHEIQKARFVHSRTHYNAYMTLTEIKTFCTLTPDCEDIMEKAISRFQLSGRSFHKTVLIARTIADLAQSEHITPKHLTEALLFRPQPI